MTQTDNDRRKEEWRVQTEYANRPSTPERERQLILAEIARAKAKYGG